MLAAAQGSSSMKDKFGLMHVSFQNSDKTLRNTTSVLEDLADRFHGMPDGPTKTALALQLLGRSGKEMIPLLNEGGESIRSMVEEAKQLGLVIGVIYALIAMGLSLIFGVLEIVNFAHGEFYMLGAMLAYFLATHAALSRECSL